MPVDTFIALILFVALMVGTPGPANLLAMVLGANWGVRGGLSFISGTVAGQMALNIMIALAVSIVLLVIWLNFT